jgi:hypothetical protein
MRRDNELCLGREQSALIGSPLIGLRCRFCCYVGFVVESLVLIQVNKLLAVSCFLQILGGCCEDGEIRLTAGERLVFIAGFEVDKDFLAFNA